MLLQIAPEFPVPSLQEAIDYYEQKLGFEIVIDLPEQKYAVVERDDLDIHLFEGNGSPAAVHIFATDLEELEKELRDRGAQISQPVESKAWGTRDFRIHDPGGNEIKFTEAE